MTPRLSLEVDNRILYKKGTKVWIEDRLEGWIRGVVKNFSEKSTSISLPSQEEEEEEKEIVVKSIPPLCNDPDQWFLNDMTSLTYLHEPAILQTIQTRFLRDQIYTYSGIVLISVNPFKKIPGLYSDDKIHLYHGQPLGRLEPHLYALAENAFQFAKRDNQSQSIIVSGESGAGKTVSAKFVVRYLAAAGAMGGGKHTNVNIEQQIMASQPILEAIGNSKTTRNDNSSRFGKFLQLQMAPQMTITGATIRTYLLEKSRVVFHSPQERNYHIFYQLIAGCPSNHRLEWQLLSTSDYRYTNQGVDTIAQVDDAEEFNEVLKSLRIVGLSQNIIDCICKTLVGILYLGNIACEESGVKRADKALAQAGKLLDVKPLELMKWINKKKLTAGKEVMFKPNSRAEQFDAVDALAKAIYGKVFDFLVMKINEQLSGRSNNLFIGILDIYGFESFDNNSFEQFCINYANETLQQEFNSHVFKKEQDDYVSEEIQWSFIGFQDNKPCLELIEAKIGILSMLDEECVLRDGSDENFLNKLLSNFRDNKYFDKPKLSGKKRLFIVKHYAHPVTYDVEGFLDKNKDRIADELLKAIKDSKSAFIKEIFNTENTGTPESAGPPKPAPKPTSGAPVPAPKPASAPVTAKKTPPTKRKMATVGNKFKSSLHLLMETICSTNSHYIRCLKPNMQKKDSIFTRNHILEQLRACGVLSTIKISQAGYPGKIEYSTFYDRYKVLLEGTFHPGKDIKGLCDIIVRRNLSEENYQFGKTMVLLRSGQQALLEAKRSHVLSKSAIKLQAFTRGVLARNYYLDMFNAAIILQSYFRSIICRLKVKQIKKQLAATTIQKWWKSILCQYDYEDMKIEHRAATKVQKQFRCYVELKKYRRIIYLITRLQALQRRNIVINKFRQQRDEKRQLRVAEQKQQPGQRISASMNESPADKAYNMEKKVMELQMKMDQQARSFERKEEELLKQISHLKHTSYNGDKEDRTKASKMKRRSLYREPPKESQEDLKQTNMNLKNKVVELHQQINAFGNGEVSVVDLLEENKRLKRQNLNLCEQLAALQSGGGNGSNVGNDTIELADSKHTRVKPRPPSIVQKRNSQSGKMRSLYHKRRSNTRMNYKCFRCQKSVLDNPFHIQALDSVFHPACFYCELCSLAFRPEINTVTVLRGNPCCPDCLEAVERVFLTNNDTIPPEILSSSSVTVSHIPVNRLEAGLGQLSPKEKALSDKMMSLSIPEIKLILTQRKVSSDTVNTKEKLIELLITAIRRASYEENDLEKMRNRFSSTRYSHTSQSLNKFSTRLQTQQDINNRGYDPPHYPNDQNEELEFEIEDVQSLSSHQDMNYDAEVVPRTKDNYTEDTSMSLTPEQLWNRVSMDPDVFDALDSTNNTDDDDDLMALITGEPIQPKTKKGTKLKSTFKTPPASEDADSLLDFMKNSMDTDHSTPPSNQHSMTEAEIREMYPVVPRRKSKGSYLSQSYQSELEPEPEPEPEPELEPEPEPYAHSHNFPTGLDDGDESEDEDVYEFKQFDMDTQPEIPPMMPMMPGIPGMDDEEERVISSGGPPGGDSDPLASMLDDLLNNL